MQLKSKFKGKSKIVRAMFYRTEAGNEPVRKWLWSLSDEDCNTVGYAISEVEFGWPMGMPLCRSMGDGLHELRVNLEGNRIAEYSFSLTGKCGMVIVACDDQKDPKDTDGRFGTGKE